MGLLLASHDAPPALARSPLDLVVQVYVATYIVFALAGAACLGIAGIFNRRKEGGGDSPPEAGGRDPKSRPPVFGSHAGRANLRADGKRAHAPSVNPRSQEVSGTGSTQTHYEGLDMEMIGRNAAINMGDAGYLDWTGAATSGLCALHCALLPVVASVLPMIGLGLLVEERTEVALIGASATLGAISLGVGFRQHRSGRALIVLAIGLGMLALGRFAEARDSEAVGMVAVASGGLAIAWSHLLNRRLCRTCPRCGRIASRRGENSASPVGFANLDKEHGEARS